MAASTTSLGDHMYDIFGGRVLTLPSGTPASQVFVANLTSISVLAGKALRGITVSGALRKILPGITRTVRWGTTAAVFGAEAPDGIGRVQVPFTINVPLRGAPYALAPSTVDAVTLGLSVFVATLDAAPLPGGSYVAINSSTIYYSSKPSFALELPDEIAAGEVVDVVLRMRYLTGDVVDGQAVKLSNSTGDVALSYVSAPPSNEINPVSDANGEINFKLHGVRTGGDAISVRVETPGFFSPALNVVFPINGSGMSGGCVVVPAAPGVPSVPGYEVRSPQAGWDSGARSVTQLSGDAELSFSMGDVVGVVVGITPAGTDVAVREAITHGFYMFTDGGRARQFQVYESGERIGVQGTYAVDDVFYIRRVGDRVFYSLENAGQVFFRYASRVPLAGDIEALSALYASGDQVA